MLKRILRNQGFTLMELLVVVGILGVLMAIVAPVVTGTRASGQEGQIKSDGKAAQTGVENFNNKSIDSEFPDLALTAQHRYTQTFDVGAGLGVGVVLRDSKGNRLGDLADEITSKKTGIKQAERAVLDFESETDVYQQDGSIGAATYTPDFLTNSPGSVILAGDETRKLDDNFIKEYLWLMRINSPGTEQESRTVQVFRLQNAVCMSGGTQAGSVEKLARDHFANVRGGSDTATIAVTGSGSTNIVTYLALSSTTKPATFTDATVSSVAKAKKVLTDENTDLGNARSALATAQKTLDDAEVALATAVAANVGVSTATTTRDNAKTARNDAKAVVEGGLHSTLGGSTGIVNTGGSIGTSTTSAIRQQAIAQEDFALAMEILKAVQKKAAENAVGANPRCEAGASPLQLSYDRNF